MYNIEIFDSYNRRFVDAFVANDDTVIKQDYINPVKFDVVGPAGLSCEIRNTVRIMKDNLNFFNGWISDIERTQTRTVLTLAPLILLFNEKSVQNVVFTDWARQIDRQIWYDFQQATPSLYAFPAVHWGNVNYDNWGGKVRPYGAELLNDMECMINAAKTYGLFMSFGLGQSAAWLGVCHYGFQKFTTERVIERDLDNIIEKEINETSANGYNIAMIWVKRSDDSDAYIHYDVLLINGDIVIDGSRKSEIDEPRLTVKKFDDRRRFTSDELYQMGVQMLKPSADSYDITLTVPIDDKIINNPMYWLFGQPTRIISGGKEYTTYFTGREVRKDTVKMKFGMTRQTLTSILNNERNNES